MLAIYIHMYVSILCIAVSTEASALTAYLVVVALTHGGKESKGQTGGSDDAHITCKEFMLANVKKRGGEGVLQS